MVLRCSGEGKGLPVWKFKVIFIYEAKLPGSQFGLEPTLCSPAQPWEGRDVHSSLPPPLPLRPGLLRTSCHSWKSQEASLGCEMTCSTAPSLCPDAKPAPPPPCLTLLLAHTVLGQPGCGRWPGILRHQHGDTSRDATCPTLAVLHHKPG